MQTTDRSPLTAAATPRATDDMSGDMSSEELLRYSRHLTLPGVGIEGQRRLRSARVLLIGAGGLGSPAALYLAAAGVGHLGLVDFDAVDLTNLHRQILHGTSDLGRPKIDSARDRLADINPHVSLETFHETLTSRNALAVLDGYDVIVDGSDNFPTRYLVNDACALLGKPNVYGSISRFEGQASVFGMPDGPCYRCLFREPPPPGMVPSCAEGGVFGVLPGLIGTIQATETLKLLLGIGRTLAGRLLLVDALRMSFRTIELRRDPECRLCGTHEITELTDYEAFCGVAPAAAVGAPAGATDAAMAGEPATLTPRQLADRLTRGDVELIDVREPYEWQMARLPSARLVPLRTLPASIDALPRDRDIVVYCHHGSRSASAQAFLLDAGFERVWNLVGGIDRWSREVDPAVPRY